ncbi:hypothetical protein AVEN_6068-1 [Araneus ventricosus]|uniref:Uncharacterized protein n=1 Tax=Araneus ventricosus TaxID=182803 RepID=A0A4Y2NXP5_ARAVE|nr:hypothetical protein AVEN_6068-1 [Araneus ventricosus]
MRVKNSSIKSPEIQNYTRFVSISPVSELRWGGRVGPVVRSRLRGRRAPISKPDSTEDPPYILAHKIGLFLFNPLTPSGPQNLTTFVYGGFVDIWILEMDSSAFSLFLLTVGGRKRTGA